MTYSPAEADKIANEALALGALHAVLMNSTVADVEPAMDEHDIVIGLRVSFPFLRSPYLLTVDQEVSGADPERIVGGDS